MKLSGGNAEDMLIDVVPIRRIGTKEDIAYTSVFLAWYAALPLVA